MKKLQKSQILMLLGLTSLLILTPLLSSSLRPTYLYFIFNLLIISLSVEAGLLSNSPTEASPSMAETSGKKPKVIEKSQSEKITGNFKTETMKKCPSSSSIFFIGDGEAEEREREEREVEEREREEREGGLVMNGQELFTQAEMFIGNFYKQLKMQREESWKNIHGFYQKGF